MKKLIISNSVLLLLLFSVFIFGYYFFEYPEDFHFSKVIKGAEWGPLSVIILAMVVAAVCLSFFRVKNFTFTKKVLLFFGGFQVLFLSFLLFKMVDVYSSKKNEFERLLSAYRKKAELDIKSGLIVIDYVGGFEMLPSQQEQSMRQEIDSIRRTFGLAYRNSGCIYSAAIIKAQGEYVRLTKPHLDKRNGVGWEHRMRRQIERIQENYH